MQHDLAEKNISLIIEHKDPSIVIPEWIESQKVNSLYFQKEWTKEEITRENQIREKISKSVKVHSTFDQFLFHPDDLPMSLEELPEVFTTIDCDVSPVFHR